ncbi:MAG: 4-hydroxybenzoate octaprenyltransferase [Pseudomonadota bacterium]|nr:4-hydroxybenzoate octaprenyltransferase [Pseudomonadota bacterium]MDO7711552.1 4-hydroxybenzoate octaprenyltransferase [Pseudomonadota bacterium]
MDALKQTLWPYIELMRLDKPIGILLLLWPTLSALWIAAEGWPDLTVFSVFVLGVIIMRSAGCVVNDYADRNVDGHVTRTINRPLIRGDVTSRQALILFASLGLLAFFLVAQLNELTMWMSLVAMLLATIYPFMKRYTYLPQVFLGMAFGWAIPMAFAAQTNAVPTIAWLLFLANILWTTAYDTFYAMADREDDMFAGVKSTAILFGDDDLVIIGVLQFIFLLVMVLIGSQLEMSISYYIGVLGAGLLSIYQQYVAKDKQPAHCLQAFLNNNWVGGVIFLGIVFHYALS